VVLRVAGSLPVYAGGLLGAYAVGHCLVIVLAGTFTGMLQRYLNWTQASRGAVILRRVCGVLILIAGLYMLCNAR